MRYLLTRVFFVRVTLEQLLLAVAGPGELTGHQVEEEDAQSEGVGLEGVYFFLKRLWRHIERASHHIHLLHLGFPALEIARESKIPNFPHIALEEDVGRLDVSMRDEVTGEVTEPVDKLMGDIPPVDVGVALDVVLKSAPLTEFGDDVAVVLGVVDLVEFDDVFMVQLLQDFDLIPEQLALGFIQI